MYLVTLWKIGIGPFVLTCLAKTAKVPNARKVAVGARTGEERMLLIAEAIVWVVAMFWN